MIGRKSRELALRALYQLDVGKGEPDEALAAAMAAADDEEVDSHVETMARRLLLGVLAHQEEVDGWVGGLARGWDVKRMAAVDRNLLRLAAYELGFLTDVPGAVVINEAVELAKLYSTEESGKFVNGILSALAARLPGRLTARPRAEEDSDRVSPAD